MRFRPHELFLGVFLTVAVFAVGMTFESQRHLTDQPASTNATQIDQNHDHIAFSWDWLTRDGTVFFTFVLAFVAGIQAYLFLRQLRYMKDGIIDASLAAKAADLNARAVIALQLPLVQIQPSALGNGWHDATENCSVHFVDIVNRGKSRAFPKEILYGWTVGNILPIEPFYRFLDKFPLGSIIEPDAPSPIRRFLTFDCSLKPGEWAEICKGNYLWFYVDLIYDDFMGEARHQSSCWRWAYIGNGMGWRPDETSAYNRKT